MAVINFIYTLTKCFVYLYIHYEIIIKTRLKVRMQRASNSIIPTLFCILLQLQWVYRSRFRKEDDTDGAWVSRLYLLIDRRLICNILLFLSRDTRNLVYCLLELQISVQY